MKLMSNSHARSVIIEGSLFDGVVHLYTCIHAIGHCSAFISMKRRGDGGSGRNPWRAAFAACRSRRPPVTLLSAAHSRLAGRPA
jgi:hypothetical protein